MSYKTNFTMKVTPKQYDKARAKIAKNEATVTAYLKQEGKDPSPIIEEIKTRVNTLTEIMQELASALYERAIPYIPNRTEFDEDLIAVLDDIACQFNNLEEL